MSECLCEKAVETLDFQPVCQILKKYEDEQGALMAILQEIQDEYGYLPKPILEYVAKETSFPLSDIWGVATFYNRFRLTPKGEHTILVCHGTACHVAGAGEISYVIEDELKVKDGETTEDGKYTIERVACLGCCSLAPVVMIDDTTYGRLNAQKVKKIIQKHGKDS